MAKQQQKKFRKNSSAGKNPLNWLWGRQSVIETLEIGRWRVYELYVNEETADLYSKLIQIKKSEGVELHIDSNEKLEQLSQTTEHQGIVARVSKYPYLSLDEIGTSPKTELDSHLDRNVAPQVLPLWVIIDRIQDAFQFASILRCCQSASVCGVIIGEYCQAQVTTQIARACLGAVNHFPIVQSANLSLAVQKLKDLGVTVVAYNPNALQSVGNMVFAKSTAILIGNDTHGIDTQLLSQSDHQVNIPMAGNTTTLPATAAAGILLYEIRRLRLGSPS